MDFNNKYVNSLINFIKEHKNNFKEILQKNPYNLKRIKIVLGIKIGICLIIIFFQVI